jgi:ATP-dependent Lhr-like helicase
VEGVRDLELVVRAAKRPGRSPAMAARMPLTTHLSTRVQAMLANRGTGRGFPDDVREWLEMQDWRSRLPAPGELLVESFPIVAAPIACSTRSRVEREPVAGHADHAAHGRAGLAPLGFVANDYALAVWSLRPITDPAPLLSPDILTDEFVDWVQNSHLLRRAFREVAVISGLVERQHPGKRKSGKQVTFSTDLIYDVLRKYEPDHVLIEAAWADARAHDRRGPPGRPARPFCGRTGARGTGPGDAAGRAGAGDDWARKRGPGRGR